MPLLKTNELRVADAANCESWARPPNHALNDSAEEPGVTSPTNTWRPKFGHTAFTAHEVEQLLSRDPVLIYERDANGEARFVYYRDTEPGRLLAIVLTERGDEIRVITAYELDAGQKRDYLERRTKGE
jgi:uncharacterized DUF497 family protein